MNPIIVRIPETPPARPQSQVQPTPPRPAGPPRALPPRPCVLVLTSPDGHVEVFASPGVRVHVAERLDVHPANESRADEYLFATLPAWARDIYQASDLMAVHTIRPRYAQEELDRRLDLALVREASEIGRRRPESVRPVILSGEKR